MIGLAVVFFAVYFFDSRRDQLLRTQTRHADRLENRTFGLESSCRLAASGLSGKTLTVYCADRVANELRDQLESFRLDASKLQSFERLALKGKDGLIFCQIGGQGHWFSECSRTRHPEDD